jgi:hypothetical protein
VRQPCVGLDGGIGSYTLNSTIDQQYRRLSYTEDSYPAGSDFSINSLTVSGQMGTAPPPAGQGWLNGDGSSSPEDPAAFHATVYDVATETKAKITRKESYLDSFLSMSLTDTASVATITDDKHATFANGKETYTWHESHDESGTETATGTLLSAIPDSNNLVPGEVNDYLLKQADIGITGQFSLSGEETHLLQTTETGDYSDGKYTRIETETDTLKSAVQTRRPPSPASNTTGHRRSISICMSPRSTPTSTRPAMSTPAASA